MNVPVLWLGVAILIMAGVLLWKYFKMIKTVNDEIEGKKQLESYILIKCLGLLVFFLFMLWVLVFFDIK